MCGRYAVWGQEVGHGFTAINAISGVIKFADRRLKWTHL